MTPAGFAQRLFGSLVRDPVKTGGTVWFFRRDRIAVTSLVALTVICASALFAPFLTRHPNQGRGEPNIVERFQAPSQSHPFGTDQLGRDVYARVLFGGRSSLLSAFAVVILAAGFGTVMGAVAGFIGGWLDEAIMRATDIFLAFPPLLLAITIATVLEPGLKNTVLAISVTWWPWYARIVRGLTLTLRERHFVKAAQVMGVSRPTIIRRHVLPNILAPVLVQGTLDLGSAILTVSGLNFLGLGVRPPTADWGTMISEGRLFVQSGVWWVATFPGLAIFVSSLAFNLLGDGIQVAADPRTRRLS